VIFKRPDLLTHLDIWAPRYSDKYKEGGEWVALLACYKVDQASPWIIIEFTKAKHLIGQRYCIPRKLAQDCPIDSNSKIRCYAVPLKKMEHWDTVEETKAIVEELFHE
jgi:hypothetical protein